MKNARFVLMLGTVLCAENVLASNCIQMPDCSSLGYTKTESDCNDKPTIFCPTDKSKVFCSGDKGTTSSTTNTFNLTSCTLKIDCSGSSGSGHLAIKASASKGLLSSVSVAVSGNMTINSMGNTKTIDSSVTFPASFTSGEQQANISVSKSECLSLQNYKISGALKNQQVTISGLDSSWQTTTCGVEVSVTTGSSSSGSSGGGGTGESGVGGNNGSIDTGKEGGCGSDDGAACNTNG